MQYWSLAFVSDISDFYASSENARFLPVKPENTSYLYRLTVQWVTYSPVFTSMQRRLADSCTSCTALSRWRDANTMPPDKITPNKMPLWLSATVAYRINTDAVVDISPIKFPVPTPSPSAVTPVAAAASTMKYQDGHRQPPCKHVRHARTRLQKML